jgi:hypothetical protein
MMSRHNKKRNTAFIYEVLLREVVKQSVSKNNKKRNTAIEILKERYGTRTQLRQELDLFKVLCETKNLPERLAEKLVNESIKQHQKINQAKLFKEQSSIISLINKKLSKSVFSNFVPNYKSLATISQIFSNNLNPKSKILLETKVAQNLMVKSQKEQTAKNISNLVMRNFTKKFNETYGELLEEQREMLKRFVNSFADNGVEFKFYLNEEIGRLKEVTAKSSTTVEIQEDTALKLKLNKVKEILENFNKAPIDREKLIQILQVQNLAKELVSQ